MGALRNAFRNPRNVPEKSPEKFSGLDNLWDFWETHARLFILGLQPRDKGAMLGDKTIKKFFEEFAW